MLKPLSVQLYSLREYAEKDFVSVLKRVAAIGYKGVEPAGFWDIRPSQLKKIVEDLGMKIYSSHSPWAHGSNMGECMELADILSLKTIVCGYGPNEFKDMDSIKQTAETTNKMCEIAEANGFTMFQHNHAFEFERLNGKYKYEIYAELCPKVKFELDSFWSANMGKENPVEALQKFAPRVILSHIKDGQFVQNVQVAGMVNGILDMKADMMPLGTGAMPIKELVANMPEQLQAIVVELDYCESVEMFKAIEISYKYMTENGLAEGNK